MHIRRRQAYKQMLVCLGHSIIVEGQRQVFQNIVVCLGHSVIVEVPLNCSLLPTQRQNEAALCFGVGAYTIGTELFR